MADEQELIIRIKALVDDYLKGMNQASQSTEKVGKQAKTTGAGLGGLKMGFLAVVGAITGVIAIVNKLVKAFMEQEKADMMLENSLKRIGRLDVFGELKNQASEFQKTTTYGDEVVQNSFTRLIDLTGSAETAMRAMPVVADLAAAKNMDLAMAADLVGRTASGNIGALGRYGITMEEVKAKGGGLDAVLTVLNEKFGGSASAAAQSFSGQLTMMKNRLGDVAETLGKSFMPFVTKVMGLLVPLIEGLLPKLTPLLDMVAGLLEAILPPIMEFVNALLPPIMEILGLIIPPLTEIIKQLLPPLLKVLQAILMPLLGLVKEILPPILAFVQPLLDILTPIIELMAELYGAILKPLMPIISELVKAVLPLMVPALEAIAKALEWSVGLIIKGVEWLMKLLGLSRQAQEEIAGAGQNRAVSIAERAANIAAGKRPAAAPSVGGMPAPEAAGGKGKAEYIGITPSSMKGIARQEGMPDFWEVRREVSALAAEIPIAIPKILKALEKFKDVARVIVQDLADVFSNAFQALFKGFFEPLKIELDSGMNAFQKFGATLVNGMVDFLSKIVQQILIQGLAVAGIVTLLNLIPPGGIGTFLLRMLTGISSEQAQGALSGGFGKLFSGLAFGGFDNPVNDMTARRWASDLGTNLTAGLKGALPMGVKEGQAAPVVHIHTKGTLGDFVKFMQGASESDKRLFNRGTLRVNEAGA